MTEIYCVGCGAKIQIDNEDEMGYLPKSKFDSLETGEQVVCKRCFRISNYNEVNNFSVDSSYYMDIVSTIASKDALVVMVIDIFDFSGSVIGSINRLIANNDLLIVANKSDLLPKSVKHSKLIHWLKKMLADELIKYQDLCLISSTKGHNIDNVMQLIENYRKRRDVYIVGTTNVGKSTFVNTLLKNFSDSTKDVITVSNMPGTTLGFIEFPIDSKSSIIDTPGLVNKYQFAHYVDNTALKAISPKKEIKSKVFQLNPLQSIYIGALARMDFNSGDKANFVCYFAEGINLHRCKTERVDDLFELHKGTVLVPTLLDKDAKLDNKYTFNVKNDQKYDIVISGLGFITVSGGRANISVFVPKGVGVYMRMAII